MEHINPKNPRKTIGSLLVQVGDENPFQGGIRLLLDLEACERSSPMNYALELNGWGARVQVRLSLGARVLECNCARALLLVC